ncbi:hypothetical protein A4R44_00198 [Amycolatopsis sp. M39]|nr:hypothetical protein A4R44_00198 [Amycolatopsis sp. M39]
MDEANASGEVKLDGHTLRSLELVGATGSPSRRKPEGA